MSNPDHIKTDIKVKLIPKSSRNQIQGKEGDVYRVKITSAPVDGKANKALIGLLSKRLGVSKSHVEILSGKRSRLKSIRIHGLSIGDIKKTLAPYMPIV